MIVLVGFMGAGKTTVGRILADELGLPFVDTDALIERRSGMSIPELFAAGEGRFREVERDVVEETLAGPESVVSLGGGAIGDPATCAELEWARVIHLDVTFHDALERIGKDADRPMLSIVDPKALFVEREEAYRRVADLRVDTSGKAVEEVVSEVIDVLGIASESRGWRRVEVSLAQSSYTVTIGSGLLEQLLELYPDLASAEQAMIITHPLLGQRAEALSRSIAAQGMPSQIHEVPEGEGAKSLRYVEQLYDAFANAGAHRNDVVIGLGGGVVTDIAGFVASTYHRGMRSVLLPTTLLGQVDAAIGGKTAVNLAAGKNLVGTFHQPEAVVCDVSVLATLPPREFRSGLAEVAKYGFISDPSLLDLLEDEDEPWKDATEDSLARVIARSVAIKATVVSADERDQGTRAILNYGHTIGHAIEHAWADRDIRHGEAISLGMVAAALIAQELGLLDASEVARHRSVLGGLGLPVAAEVDIDELEPFLKQDKKFDRVPRFVLLEKIGRPRAGIKVPREVLAKALGRMRAT